MLKLKFGRGNAKLDKLEEKTGKRVYTFSILSGWTCPYAKDCHSKVVEIDGKLKIQDGKHTQFRCFSASQESLFTNVYNVRKHNSQLVELAARSIDDAAQCIVDNIPTKAGIIRIHVGGDFKTKNYMAAWIKAATMRPDIIFYGYTKSIPFWIALKDSIPSNMILTASYGGYRDDLIEKHGLRYAKVVYSTYEARKLKLPIDNDDYHAYNPNSQHKSFALLVHGIQPAGSEAGKAVRKLKGKGSYSKGK